MEGMDLHDGIFLSNDVYFGGSKEAIEMAGGMMDLVYEWYAKDAIQKRPFRDLNEAYKKVIEECGGALNGMDRHHRAVEHRFGLYERIEDSLRRVFSGASRSMNVVNNLTLAGQGVIISLMKTKKGGVYPIRVVWTRPMQEYLEIYEQLQGSSEEIKSKLIEMMEGDQMRRSEAVEYISPKKHNNNVEKGTHGHQRSTPIKSNKRKGLSGEERRQAEGKQDREDDARTRKEWVEENQEEQEERIEEEGAEEDGQEGEDDKKTSSEEASSKETSSEDEEASTENLEGSQRRAIKRPEKRVYNGKNPSRETSYPRKKRKEKRSRESESTNVSNSQRKRRRVDAPVSSRSNDTSRDQQTYKFSNVKVFSHSDFMTVMNQRLKDFKLKVKNATSTLIEIVNAASKKKETISEECCNACIEHLVSQDDKKFKSDQVLCLYGKAFAAAYVTGITLVIHELDNGGNHQIALLRGKGDDCPLVRVALKRGENMYFPVVEDGELETLVPAQCDYGKDIGDQIVENVTNHGKPIIVNGFPGSPLLSTEKGFKEYGEVFKNAYSKTNNGKRIQFKEISKGDGLIREVQCHPHEAIDKIIHHVDKGDYVVDISCAELSLEACVSEMSKKLPEPYTFNSRQDVLNYNDVERVYLYISKGGVTTRLHVDADSTESMNILNCSKAKDAYKTWYIVPAQFRRFLEAFHGAAILKAQFSNPDERLIGLWRIPHYVIIQRNGDIVYVPADCPHLVVTNKTSVPRWYCAIATDICIFRSLYRSVKRSEEMDDLYRRNQVSASSDFRMMETAYRCLSECTYDPEAVQLWSQDEETKKSITSTWREFIRPFMDRILKDEIEYCPSIRYESDCTKCGLFSWPIVWIYNKGGARLCERCHKESGEGFTPRTCISQPKAQWVNDLDDLEEMEEVVLESSDRGGVYRGFSPIKFLRDAKRYFHPDTSPLVWYGGQDNKPLASPFSGSSSEKLAFYVEILPKVRKFAYMATEGRDPTLQVANHKPKKKKRTTKLQKESTAHEALPVNYTPLPSPLDFWIPEIEMTTSETVITTPKTIHMMSHKQVKCMKRNQRKKIARQSANSDELLLASGMRSEYAVVECFGLTKETSITEQELQVVRNLDQFEPQPGRSRGFIFAN
ncbi:erythrocyte binding protein [Planoprotostelium fungivorum]|uniref:Erythrocyte binding protein n=1 Tax=Planoprotostelium fungivorum TaxID=1890364 RepID=A0A2P6N888_9EUKA|nr:erythrocyte binding protein [Planoprotostelium fungivorum]